MKETLGTRPDLINKGFIYEGFDGQKHIYKMDAGDFVAKVNQQEEAFWKQRDLRSQDEVTPQPISDD